MNGKFFFLLPGIALITIMSLTAFTAGPIAPHVSGPRTGLPGKSAFTIYCQPASTEDPWKPSQLLAPADLAKTINDPHAPQPIIFCIGPGALVKNSIDIGPARDSIHLIKFKLQLNKLPKDAAIVIYCGCCPFEHCPNIRPAFALLNEMNFTHHKLLNIEHNIKTDWINKDYPLAP